MYQKKMIAISALGFVVAAGTSTAGETIHEAGAIACVTDRWDEKELEKGHKQVESACRCVLVPDDPAAPKVTEACTGYYEYMPDKSWMAKGTCTDTFPGGDQISLTREEGSHLKEYTYRKTGGTGKYQGVSGGGTYMYETLTDTPLGGRYKGTLELP